MVIVKYFFLLCLFVSASAIGNLISKKYKNRVEELKSFKEACNILESKIKFTYEPLGDIFEEISNILQQSNIHKIFEGTSLNMKNENFRVAWENAIEVSKPELNLKNEDINLIKSLGNMLRKD